MNDGSTAVAVRSTEEHHSAVAILLKRCAYTNDRTRQCGHTVTAS